MFWSNRCYETRTSVGTKKILKAVAFQTIIAWWLGTAVYQIGSKIEKGTVNLANIVVIGIIIAIVVLILSKENKNRGCTKCPYVKECDKRK